LDLMRRHEPLVVDARDAAEFTEEFFPVLHAIAPVTRKNESVELPEAQPPRLALLVVFGEDDEAELQWSWAYTGPRREYPIVPGAAPGGRRTTPGTGPAGRSPGAEVPAPQAVTGTSGAGRDTAAESAIRDRVAAVWPGAGTAEREDLAGVDTAAFTVRVLPRLEELDCVRVEVSGAR